MVHFVPAQVRCKIVLLQIIQIIVCGASGSVLGPFLFPLQTTPLSSILTRHTGVKFLYAKDTQLYIHLAPHNVPQAFEKLNSCLTYVMDWMSECKLKLNLHKLSSLYWAKKGSEICLRNAFQSTYWADLCILLIQSEIWVFGLIQICHSVSMSMQFAKVLCSSA